jgi:glycosyltransferase involved in cell wall biosynthesis
MVLVANYDAGHTDSTPDVVRRFAAGKPAVRFVAEPKDGRGMGWDMRRGLEAARGEHLVVIDGDSQNPVADVFRAYEEMVRTGVDVIKGRRVKRGDGPYRRLTSLVYNLLFMVMFGTRSLWDINGKPKGIRRDALRPMDLHSDDWFIDAEIVLAAKRAGMRVGELSVHFNANEKRASFVKPWAVVEFLVNMVCYRLNRR